MICAVEIQNLTMTPTMSSFSFRVRACTICKRTMEHYMWFSVSSFSEVYEFDQSTFTSLHQHISLIGLEKRDMVNVHGLCSEDLQSKWEWSHVFAGLWRHARYDVWRVHGEIHVVFYEFFSLPENINSTSGTPLFLLFPTRLFFFSSQKQCPMTHVLCKRRSVEVLISSLLNWVCAFNIRPKWGRLATCCIAHFARLKSSWRERV